MENTQQAKAEAFRQLHLDKKLLILPNAWDLVSAKLIETSGFPAVATASVATALVNGYPDGEKIPFPALLNLVNQLANALTIPLTVDIEHGFADDISTLKANIELLIENGMVGINIEDGMPGKQQMENIDDQCKRIRSVRETAEKLGIAIVINARTDVFLLAPGEDNLKEVIARTFAYKNAGADCVYPIMMHKYEDLETLVNETKVPINVNLQKRVNDLKKLEDIGVSRVSLGPGFLYHTLAKMNSLAKELQQYDTKEYFEQEPLPKDFLNKFLFKL